MSDYDTDFYAWTQAQAAALRAKDWPALDVAHLAEEIADVGNAQRFTLESHLERLLLHLLKYRYDPAQLLRRDWRLTIRHARDDAQDATRLPLATFPEVCPWPVEQVLDAAYWPAEEGTR